jgi:hypothetical protein
MTSLSEYEFLLAGNGGTPRVDDPTEAELKVRTAWIRATWTQEDFERRYVGKPLEGDEMGETAEDNADRFRRDFESVDEYRRRLRDEGLPGIDQEAEVAAELPSLWVVDQGPRLNAKADEEAICREAQRLFELDQRDRIPR